MHEAGTGYMGVSVWLAMGEVEQGARSRAGPFLMTKRAGSNVEIAEQGFQSEQQYDSCMALEEARLCQPGQRPGQKAAWSGNITGMLSPRLKAYKGACCRHVVY